MNGTPLPVSIVKDLRQCFGQPQAAIGDHQPNAFEAACNYEQLDVRSVAGLLDCHGVEDGDCLVAFPMDQEDQTLDTA